MLDVEFLDLAGQDTVLSFAVQAHFVFEHLDFFYLAVQLLVLAVGALQVMPVDLFLEIRHIFAPNDLVLVLDLRRSFRFRLALVVRTAAVHLVLCARHRILLRQFEGHLPFY